MLELWKNRIQLQACFNPKQLSKDEKKQDESLNSSHTNQPISYLIEKDHRLHQTPNSVTLDLEPVKVLETKKSLNSINAA